MVHFGLVGHELVVQLCSARLLMVLQRDEESVKPQMGRDEEYIEGRRCSGRLSKGAHIRRKDFSLERDAIGEVRLFDVNMREKSGET